VSLHTGIAVSSPATQRQHKVQHRAALDVVVLGHLVVIHGLSGKD
jgi:hypothetical protein